MFRKWFVPVIAVGALAFLTPLDASAQLGKKGGGGKGGGGASGGSGGSGGGGKVEPPPKKNNGGGQSGGSGGSLGKGGGSSGGTSSGSTGSRGDVRTSPPQSRGGSDVRSTGGDVFRKTQPSRSGDVRYGSTSNLITEAKGRPGNVVIPNAPTINRSNRSSRDVLREDRTIANKPYRTGYYNSSPWWRDDYFYYPYYAFSYRPGYCYPSPFYYYPHVPGYIAAARITVGSFSFSFLTQNHYSYRPSRGYGGYGGYSGYDYRGGGYGGRDRYNSIDRSIDNIVTAFESGRMRYIEQMVPRHGYVSVALEDDAEYRMQSDDFFDLLTDIVEGTDTRDYRVSDVRYGRNGEYVVYAEHTFRDAFGHSDTKYHTITLEPDREGYEITYFRVDRHRNW